MASGAAHRVVSGLIDKNGRALLRLRCFLGKTEASKKQQYGWQLPSPEIITGLVDTGCSGFALGARVARRLGLDLRDSRPTKTAAGEMLMRHYDASIEILNDSDGVIRALPELRVHELPDQFDQFEALIGWDVLENAELAYSGPSRRFQLKF